MNHHLLRNGVLMDLGGFYAATGSIDPMIFLVSASLGLFITAVLFANNMRDLDHDREAGIKTLANILGREREAGSSIPHCCLEHY